MNIFGNFAYFVVNFYFAIIHPFVKLSIKIKCWCTKMKRGYKYMKFKKNMVKFGNATEKSDENKIYTYFNGLETVIKILNPDDYENTILCFYDEIFNKYFEDEKGEINTEIFKNNYLDCFKDIELILISLLTEFLTKQNNNKINKILIFFAQNVIATINNMDQSIATEQITIE